MARFLPLVALCIFSGFASGCGPIISVSLLIDAEAKLAAAKAAEADRYAPYEWTTAEEYLKKAHEELGYADYGPAIDYAYKAADAAEKGAQKASDERSKHLDAPPIEVQEGEEVPAQPNKAAPAAQPSSSSSPSSSPWGQPR